MSMKMVTKLNAILFLQNISSNGWAQGTPGTLWKTLNVCC